MLAVRITALSEPAAAQGKEGGKGVKVQGKVQGKVVPAVGWVRPRLRVKPTAVVHDELCGIVERSPRGLARQLRDEQDEQNHQDNQQDDHNPDCARICATRSTVTNAWH